MPKQVIIQTTANVFKKALKNAYLAGVHAVRSYDLGRDLDKFADQYVHDVFGKNVDQYELHFIRNDR
jgi:hypothetical protein